LCAFCNFSLIMLFSNLLWSLFVMLPRMLLVVVLSKLNFTLFMLFVVFALITEFSYFIIGITSNRNFINVSYFLRYRYLVCNEFLNAEWFECRELVNVLNVLFAKFKRSKLWGFSFVKFYCGIYQNFSVVCQDRATIRPFARVRDVVFKFVCIENGIGSINKFFKILLPIGIVFLLTWRSSFPLLRNSLQNILSP
jgi:hypothetical protein